MSALPSAVPGEYREDHKGAVLPGGVRGIDVLTALIAIILFAVLIELARKKTRGKAGASAGAQGAARF
jgi:hypothetical protein